MFLVGRRPVLAFSTACHTLESRAWYRRSLGEKRCARPCIFSWPRVSQRSSRLLCSAIEPIPVSAETILKEAAKRSELSVNQVDVLYQLGDLLLLENAKYNLSGIRTRDGVIVKHIVDALSLLSIIDGEDARKVIDIGTGAGFPGLVLAIARPDIHVTLLDSARKKTKFHELAKGQLQLRNVDSLWARAEEAGQTSETREKYDVAVARSVAEMRVLAELCLPLVARDGCFIAQKTIDTRQTELKVARGAIKALGGSMERIEQPWDCESMMKNSGSIESDGRSKAIVVVRKIAATPAKYPRISGTPAKCPL